jgi:SWI/SNF-related matrix-associated actin-dependent regulator 1 of chromatin subfamily A
MATTVPTVILPSDGPSTGLMVIRFDFDPRLVTFVKENVKGRRWDPVRKIWIAPILRSNVAVLEGHGFQIDPSIHILLGPASSSADDAVGTVKERTESSSSSSSFGHGLTRGLATYRGVITPSDLPYPPLLPEVSVRTRGLFRHQVEGVKFLARRKGAILADEMGLGKTAQAAVALDTISATSAIVVCPASLIPVWCRELERWAPDYDIYPFDRKKKRFAVYPTPGIPGIWVVNYERLLSLDLAAMTFDVAIADEAHYLKNIKAQRTKAFLALHARRYWFLTGTPILNRPIELWPILHAIAPEVFPSYAGYAIRYADATTRRVAGREVWDVSGASNTGELSDILKPIMLRRLKTDVLDLPPKVRSVIETDGGTAIMREQEGLERRFGLSRREIAEILAGESGRKFTADEFSEISKVAHDLGLEKAEYVTGYVADLLEGGADAVVVMTHHKDVSENIARGISEAIGENVFVLHSDHSAEDRDQAIQGFQQSRARVLVGTIGVIGVGVTLTRASRMVFAELDWVPSRLQQAEDRIHRIGQNSTAYIDYIVVKGSLDGLFLKAIDRKMRIISEVVGDDRRA